MKNDTEYKYSTESSIWEDILKQGSARREIYLVEDFNKMYKRDRKERINVIVNTIISRKRKNKYLTKVIFFDDYLSFEKIFTDEEDFNEIIPYSEISSVSINGQILILKGGEMKIIEFREEKDKTEISGFLREKSKENPPEVNVQLKSVENIKEWFSPARKFKIIAFRLFRFSLIFSVILYIVQGLVVNQLNLGRASSKRVCGSIKG